MSLKKKPCAYCGIENAPTKDHIPPKSLFPKPRPHDLITVPSCFACNTRFQKDDDYFWLTLSIRAENSGNPAAEEASTRAISNLSRPQSGGFQRSFLASLGRVALHSPAGIYLGDHLGYRIEFARLNRVASRITKGMFCKIRNAPLAKGYVAMARAIEGFQNSGPDLEQMISFVSREPVFTIGSAFSYQSRFLDEDPNFSLWFFRIYNSTQFIGLTMLESDARWEDAL